MTTLIETLTKSYKPDAHGRERFRLIMDNDLYAIRDRLSAAGETIAAAEVTAELAERRKDEEYWLQEMARRSSSQAWSWNV